MEKLGKFFNGSGFTATDSGKFNGQAASYYMTLSGTQTITGVKTFSAKAKFTSHLVVPTVAPGTPEAGSFYFNIP